MISDSDLAKLEEMEGKATAGPWVTDGEIVHLGPGGGFRSLVGYIAFRNMEFIALSRNLCKPMLDSFKIMNQKLKWKDEENEKLRELLVMARRTLARDECSQCGEVVRLIDDSGILK